MGILEDLAEIFELDVSQINENLSLDDVPWDSLAIVSIIALVDEKYNKLLSGDALIKCKVVKDIIFLIESN